jgi:magnesium-protoporphyrin O-methyltransferase
MTCTHCKAADDVFSKGWARRELEDYRKKGAAKTTRLMLEALIKSGVRGLSLLDIGGGVGAIQHELLEAGMASGTDVDASSAYLNAARIEAERRGTAGRMQYLHGDFVDLAPTIDAADIVTLDRVVCCYPHMEKLVELSSARAKQFYALVYPRDNWLTRAGIPVFNFFAFQIWRNPFRTFVHPTPEIERILHTNGLQRVFHQYVGLWQVAIYQRSAG